jgi:protein O-GlcNAc transferase
MMTVQQAFDLALQHHQAGRLDEADAIYRQILAVQPDHADALHLLGVIAHQVGREELAIDWIRQAIAFDPNNSAAHSNLGEAYRALGRNEEAISEYRRAIQLEPDFVEAYNNLGIVLAAQGDPSEAITTFRRALELKSEYPEAHYNLGNTLKDLGHPAEAVAAFCRALELRPDYPEALNNLGNALAEQGQFDQADTAYHRALQLEPGNPGTYNNFGNALAGQGRLDEAMSAYRQAIQLKPDHAQAHNNLGTVLAKQGHVDEAIGEYRLAIQLNPTYPDPLSNLANALRSRGQLDEAIAACRHALQLKHDFPEAHNNLGNALLDGAQLGEAITSYQRALQLKPNYPEACNNLGNALRSRGQPDEAIAAYRQAIQLKPDFPDAHNNLGNALKDQGQLDGAIAEYRQALRVKPSRLDAHSNLIYTLHFHPAYDSEMIGKEQEHWNRQSGEPVSRDFWPHVNIPDPLRRLKVGYVSPDFRGHVIRHFLTPLLEAHDHGSFEIHCYASVKHPDAMTERLKRTADAWYDVLALSDESLAERIRENRIDILVDLTLHMADNRMLTFARKPGPVQVAWLGYPASTGLPAMDYRITDSLLDPEDAVWSRSVETPIRLPETWCCFDPIDKYPEPERLPALRTEHVTFGCLNNFCKVNDGVLRLWAELLRTVEGSRLLLQCPAGETQVRVRQSFAAQGVASHRLELITRTATRKEFLRLFERIDLALDPFPYNGGTTTFEALWMGLPVVSLAGEASVSRAGLSALTNVGLPELVAFSEDSYVNIATQLAHDLPRLAELRRTLRARMEASVLMDAPRFARNIEAAYREMWRCWCATEETGQ